MGKRLVMQNALLGLLCLGIVLCAKAQSLQVQGIVPNAYLTHAVQAKENWYSVGRIYNLSPREIAPFNKLTIEQPLAIGQTIKIPLTTNFSTNAQVAGDESLIPIYHKVVEKEWAYRISTNYQIPLENLEAFNKIKRDQVKAGMMLIVGYLKVKTDQSPLAVKAVKVSPGPMSSMPSTEQAASNSTPSIPPVAASTAPKTPPVTASPSAATPPVKSSAEPNPKPVVPSAETVVATPVLIKGESYFKSGFEGGKSTSGKAHIFKSSSGFTDGKYYALMNQVPIGTIVKVNANGKSIYAKVLGGLTDMKENNGLLIRISNAGATALGLGETAFNAEVQY